MLEAWTVGVWLDPGRGESAEGPGRFEPFRRSGVGPEFGAGLDEAGAQVVAGPGDAALDGADVDAELRGDLVVRVVLHVAQEQHLAVAGIELLHALRDERGELLA